MVVVLIIGILAAAIVPRVTSRIADAKRAKAASDLATLSQQLQLFHHDCDRYPTSEEGLQALRVAPSDVRNWSGPYTTKDIPADPWGNEYVYEENAGQSGSDSFTLYSYGSDGAPGGEGEAADITESSE